MGKKRLADVVVYVLAEAGVRQISDAGGSAMFDERFCSSGQIGGALCGLFD
jgi:hypothetical protein